MKHLFISDIHSNMEALDAILKKADSLCRDYGVICVGDIVGYGAEPDECFERIAGLTDRIVLGNHDAGVLGKTDTRMFNRSAREALSWTKQRMKSGNLRRMKEHPYVINENDYAVVHASMTSPEVWNYVDSVYEAQDEFLAANFRIVFIGHTHIPLIYCQDEGGVKMLFDEKISCAAGKRYIVNVGSVGQPRNQDPRACALFYDEESGELEFVKAEYDVKSAQNKIISAGLPRLFAERLERGL